MRTATGESRPDIDLSPIRELEERLDNLRIQVADDMTIRGSAWQGYALNAYTCEELGLGGITPVGTGACCCCDGSCTETNIGGCISDGCTFQSGTCDPNPCVPYGACCDGVDCSITTEADCGGVYQGDCTTCDPNPCELPPCCPDAFDAFDGSGRKFLTKTIVTTANASYAGFTGCPDTSDWSSTRTDSFDPDTCETTCECSGSGSFIVYANILCDVLDSGSTTSSGCVGLDWCRANLSADGYETISGCEVSGSSRPQAHGCFGELDGDSVVNSATSETITYTKDLSADSFFHGTVEITLSDECTP